MRSLNKSKTFYSNCLFEAIKAKMNNFNVKITYIPPKYSESYRFIPHFMWSDGVNDYDFMYDEGEYVKWYKILKFKGKIVKHDLGENDRYLKLMVNRYNKRRIRESLKC